MNRSHLIWGIAKKTNCYRFVTSGLDLSKDPLNMKGKNNFKHAGFAKHKAVGMKQAPNGRGVILLKKSTTKSRFPAKSIVEIPLTKNKRRSIKKFGKIVKTENYCKDLKMVGIRRLSGLQYLKKKTATA